MKKKTIYGFQNNNKLYNQVLKQLEQNRPHKQNQKYQYKNHNKHQYQNKYQQYSADKQNQQRNYSQQKIQCINSQRRLPNHKNQIRTRSIYTQEQSQYFGNSRIYRQDYKQEDIYKFIQNSKTLREKINQKLEKKRRNNQNKNLIVQTTFRPNQVKDNHSKQNKTLTNISYRKSLTKRQYPRSSNLQKKTRMRTQIDEANALWDKKCQRTISMLDFYQRQQKTLNDRREITKKLADEKRQKQMQGCTFKPKLTKYKPKRP